ncbi:MAG TPA: amino acid permease [Caulifigura sp.]|jgi:APA family basic amino acid/polyamine antiporter|nr:amino acid permease [Caulifigura sp.]
MDVRPLEPASESESANTLPRTLNLRDAIAIVIGSIIGSGIFLTESKVAAGVGCFGPVLAVWGIVGILSWCGALAFGELSAMMPQAGGPYVYLRAAYGRLPAFLWGWTEFWVMRTSALGTLACACVLYLEELLPDSIEPNRVGECIAASLIIIVLSWVNTRGTRWGANVQNLTTFIKASFLALLIFAPWVMGMVNADNLSPIEPQAYDFNLLKVVALAMLAVKWPYEGFANLGFIAGEVKNPQRNMPAALTIGMGTVIVLYMSAVLSYHLVMPFADVAKSQTLAADVSKVLFGSIGGTICAIGVTISALGAANSNMLTVPRIYFAMARDGLLPESVSRLHPVYKTPANAIRLQTAWAIGLLILVFVWTSTFADKAEPTARPKPPAASATMPEAAADKAVPVRARNSVKGVRASFDHLADFVIFGGEIFYGLTIAAVFVLRRRRPDLPRPYKTFGYPLTPFLYLVGAAAVLASFLTSIEKIQQMCFGFLLIGAGIPYYLWASRTERGRTGTEGIV